MVEDKITVKSTSDRAKMIEGGKKLAEVKNALMEKVGIGVSGLDIEKLANRLIERSGGKASFKMVPGYSWATCVNINQGVVHGIPKKEMVFKKGDIVSVDVGLFYKGFHTDTSFSVGLDLDESGNTFLKTGENALEKAISVTKAGNRIYDISQAIQQTIESAGYSSIRALVGHGVGKDLHEAPQIPCFTYGKREDSILIKQGHVYAIEVMYVEGNPDVVQDNDGWTISTHDGKISALFEETVAVTKKGPMVLTQ